MTDSYDATVTLHISTAAANPDPTRWHRPTRGGQPVTDYWYGYFGGTDGWGSLIFTHGSARTALLQLDSTLSGYKITSVTSTVEGGKPNDLSASRISDTQWAINDSGADVESGRYSVTVNPPSGGAMLCDPIWRND